MMREQARQGQPLVFAKIGGPSRHEMDAGEMLLLICRRRHLPGDPATREYLALAAALEAVIGGHRRLNDKEPAEQSWAKAMSALGSVIGTIFGTQFDPDCWHEQIEHLVRDIYATARQQRGT